MKTLLIYLIKLYQKTLSLLIGGSCRFYPTCSSYSIQAIDSYGCRKGLWLAAKRIAKCQPLHPGGLDLVPPKPKQKNSCGRSGHHHSSKPLNEI